MAIMRVNRRNALIPLIIAMTTVVLSIGLAAAGAYRCDTMRHAGRVWIAALDLNGPAMWAAGTPSRQPLWISPAVDLRHAPSLVPYLPDAMQPPSRQPQPNGGDAP